MSRVYIFWVFSFMDTRGEAMPEPKTLVTSALIYANGPVHIGNMLENIQTDIYVRSQRMRGRDVIYCGADDTHGAPIEINAAKQGVTPEEFIDHWLKEHLRDYRDYLISY